MKHRLRHRLYLRLYLAFLGIAILSLFVTAVLARAFHSPGAQVSRTLASLARSMECHAPGGCTGYGVEHLREEARELNLDIVVWNPDGQVVFESNPSPFAPSTLGHRRGPPLPMRMIPLGNGNTLGVRERGHFGPRGTLFLPLLLGLTVLFAIALHPLSRGITRRIEALSEGARRWGEGDLGHRIPVRGKDEIAALATRFNQTAAAIEALVAQERQMLASASHELRTPLARIRMALELLAEEASAERRSELARNASEDIAELDSLVEELLLTVRSQPGVPRRPLTQVDLLSLVKAEVGDPPVEIRGESLPLMCEPSMIKRMVRNLLTNARLHAGGAVAVTVGRDGDQALLAVEDDGPGVPESERERIFAPFYRPPGPRPPGDTGLGLGLALVRQVARYHGGDITYAARQPRGSRFEVRLPMS
jgi:signal transduction histidine kinase